MTTQYSSVEHIEQLLVSSLEAASIDLSRSGEILIERLSTPESVEPLRDARLTYHLCKAPSGVVDCHVHVTTYESQLSLDLELCLKKYLTPTLSLSSAHVASLLYHIKRSLSALSIAVPGGGTLSWEFDRTQRRVRLVEPLHFESDDTTSGVALLEQMTQLLVDCHQLSLGITQEEAEYCHAMEQWRHARRAYLTWVELEPLSVDQIQSALSVLYQLKDWVSCVRILDEVSSREEGEVGAKFAHAASVLCRDVIIDYPRALVLCQRALEMHEAPLYQQSLSTISQLIEEQHLDAEPDMGEDEGGDQSTSLDQDSPQHQTSTEDLDSLGFFDDLPFDEQSSEDEGAEQSSTPETTSDIERAPESDLSSDLNSDVDSDLNSEPEVALDLEIEPQGDTASEVEDDLEAKQPELEVEADQGAQPALKPRRANKSKAHHRSSNKKSRRGRKQKVKRKRKTSKK